MVPASLEFIKSLSPWEIKGKGFFETMRVCKGEILAFEEHMQRMLRGMNILALQMPVKLNGIKKYIFRVLELNTPGEARARLTIWREGSGRGSCNGMRISIICQPVASPSKEKYRQGFSAVTSSVRRERTRLSHFKSIEYGCFRSAFLEAEAKGCDEAILLNSKGEIVEGSRTNIFFVKNNTLYTPAVRCGCINGIMRQAVVKLARRMGITCKAVAARIDQLITVDEAFVTNSIIEIMPLTTFDGKAIGTGLPGGMTLKIRRCTSAFFY